MAWKEFILVRGLRPGDRFDPVPKTPGLPRRAPFTRDQKREFLFEIMETLDAALADGLIDVPDYLDAGANFLGPILETGRDWKAGIDEAGYLARWGECKAAAVQSALTRPSASA